MLVWVHLTGMLVFTFLAWAFSEALQSGDSVHDRMRILS